MSEELKELKTQTKKLWKELPSVMGAFIKLDKECSKEGILSNKIKELIALGISINIRCEYCIYYHTSEAVKYGASRAEILEAAGVSILIAGGSAETYVASVLLKALDELDVKFAALVSD